MCVDIVADFWALQKEVKEGKRDAAQAWGYGDEVDDGDEEEGGGNVADMAWSLAYTALALM